MKYYYIIVFIICAMINFIAIGIFKKDGDILNLVVSWGLMTVCALTIMHRELIETKEKVDCRKINDWIDKDIGVI